MTELTIETQDTPLLSTHQPWLHPPWTSRLDSTWGLRRFRGANEVRVRTEAKGAMRSFPRSRKGQSIRTQSNNQNTHVIEGFPSCQLREVTTGVSAEESEETGRILQRRGCCCRGGTEINADEDG